MRGNRLRRSLKGACNDMAYTPKEWKNGDRITAEGLNNLELDVQEAMKSGGGGGESGTGISLMEQTTSSTESGGLNVWTATLTDGTSYSLEVRNGQRGEPGSDGSPGSDGEPGQPGVTYTPSMADDGTLSWTNDGGLENPAPMNLTGPAGEDGSAGNDGAPGADGITPTIGENGNWFLGDEDTGKPSRGETGPAGPTGSDGSPGADGITPHIGDNGNWFTGDTDTGVKAQGEKGDTGYVSNAEVYSTEETIIGTWADGKPLYRQTIIAMSPATAGFHNIATITNYAEIDKYIKVDAVCNWGTVGSMGVISNGFDLPDSENYFQVYIAEGNLWVGNIAQVDCPIYINIEYTKTTDTATNALPTSEEMLAAYDEGVQSA